MRLSSLSWMDWFVRPRTNLYPKATLDFQCTVCDHRFKRKIRRVYLDLNTYDARHLDGSQSTRSEFILGERITCPNCQTVDRYKFGALAYQRLAETQLVDNPGLPHPNKPIHCIRFKLRDGRPMHPLDALETLADLVADQSDTNEIRLEYANLLRMLGYHDESEAQYRIALDRNPYEPEALLNLAVFHGKRKEKEQAVHYLFRLDESEEEGTHPDQAMYAQAARDIIDGEIQMDSIELTAPVLFDIV